MAKTSRDAYRHLRILGRFFGSSTSFSRDLIDEAAENSRQKKYLLQSLARLRQRGFLTEKSGDFVLTAAGEDFFRQRGLMARPAMKNWDGRWRLVSFDVPVDYRRERDDLRRILKMYGFYQLQKSVWICPAAISENFWRLILEKNYSRFCKMMIVEVLEGDRILKKYFNIV